MRQRFAEQWRVTDQRLIATTSPDVTASHYEAVAAGRMNLSRVSGAGVGVDALLSPSDVSSVCVGRHRPHGGTNELASSGSRNVPTSS
jgi:hypothetical protein